MKPKPAPMDQEPRCGNCHHWVKLPTEGEEIGECFFNPPQVQIDDDGYAIIRPIMDVSERACGRFKAGQ